MRIAYQVLLIVDVKGRRRDERGAVARVGVSKGPCPFGTRYFTKRVAMRKHIQRASIIFPSVLLTAQV